MIGLLRSSDALPSQRAGLDPAIDLTMLERYLVLREQGLRARMAEPRWRFAEEAAQWPLRERGKLVHWVGEPWIAATGDPAGAFVFWGDPTYREVVAPTLAAWCEHDPEDPEPQLLARLWDEPSATDDGWRLDQLRSLVARFSWMIPARRAFVRAVVDSVGFAQHELPHGYLGDPERDLMDLDEAELVLAVLPIDDWREQMTAMLSAMQAVARRSIDSMTLPPRDND